MTPFPVTPSPSDQPKSTKCLLCVDDHPEVLAIMGEFLRVFGYAVITAPSGRRGLQLLERNRVDAVILDYEMPRMDGAEVAEKVKRRWPELPVLMFTGYPTEVPARVQQSVDAFVVKGEPADKLLRSLRDVLPADGSRLPRKGAAKAAPARRRIRGRTSGRRRRSA